jgi:hypothetical protein
MADDDGALSLGLCRRGVVGSVIDDEDVESRRLALNVAHDTANHPGLVIGRHDRELRKLI